MSFRGRLGVFFVLIVAIPVAAIALLAAEVTADSQAGKADARLATGVETALAVYAEQVDAAELALTELLSNPSVVSALRSGDETRIESAFAAAGRAGGLTGLTITAPGGGPIEAIESATTVASATVRTTGDAGDFELVGSTIDAAGYAEEVKRLTGLEAAVAGPDGVVASTNGADQQLPDAGESADVRMGDADARVASGGLADAEASRVGVFTELEGGGFFDSRPRVALVVAVFLAAALVAIALAVRTLQSQIAAMLDAARRIGSGDFSRRVPVVGRDEMAGLAGEFNKMSDRLSEQIEQLRRQRTELDRSVRRLGEAFAAGLDRDALLGIVAETALGACDAEYCRVALDDGTLIERPEGGAQGTARDAGVAAQKRSSRDGVPVEARRQDGHALAARLRRFGREDDAVGTVAVGRRVRPFEQADRETLLYLIGQASASIENISAHERVSEQAVTDELTGLPNNRAFRETIDREAARAGRFGHELSLVILDIDDFKLVNDTHGHLQGDEVLRTLGDILASEPRAIDEAARYGGEEFVVALPETGIDGAVEIAERVRARLAEEEIPRLDGNGALRVTASLGTATMPGAASSVRELFSAADEALYEAKRNGKNRVVTAPGAVRSRR